MNRSEIDALIPDLKRVLSAGGVLHILGSYARGKENPTDLDLLLVSDLEFDATQALDSIGIKLIRNAGNRTIYRTSSKFQIELWKSPAKSAGSAQLFLEGPGSRNGLIRNKIRSRGFTWKFDGLYDQFQICISDGLTKEQILKFIDEL